MGCPQGEEMSMNKVIIPGYGGSGECHWQTHWETSSDGYSRIKPTSFENPDLSDWLAALEDNVVQQSNPPVLIAHSLGCLLAAEYLHRSKVDVAGVFMVAVPDPDGLNFPISEAREFAEFSRKPLRCPSLIVASSNDPYSATHHTKEIAAAWGAGVVNIGAKDHISDVGQWNAGHNLLTAFCSGIGG